MSDEQFDEKYGAKSTLSAAKSLRVRSTGLQMDALNDNLKSRISLLDDDELAVLSAIKEKLNSGLDERLKKAADTVGGFVW